MPPSSVAMAVIGNDTSMTIGLVITLGGGIAWLTKMYWEIRSLKGDMDSLKEDLKGKDETMSSRERADSERLTRLETKVEGIQDSINEVKYLMREQAKNSPKI